MFTLLSTRQPRRPAWSMARLHHERALALGSSIESSTAATYNSHLQSYLSFCKAHRFPITPTPDTLSFYIVYMASFIKPASVSAYLSGICNNLEPHFPEVRASRRSPLVSRTLAGIKKLRGNLAPSRKHPLSRDDLSQLIAAFPLDEFDNCLFVSMLLTGFFGLMRLGELTVPDVPSRRSFKKQIRRLSLKISPSRFSFHLPYHKADRFYEGNTIIIDAIPSSALNPLTPMLAYIRLRDCKFPLRPSLWLLANGQPPTYSWFVHRLQSVLGSNFAGHSLRSGGATDLALSGVSDDAIQAMGRWSSDTWRIYIREHPVLLHALIHGHSPFVTGPTNPPSS